MPATRVSSHAYVNPVVALLLGHFIAGEAITSRMLIGGLLVVVSVVLLLAKAEATAQQTASVPPDFAKTTRNETAAILPEGETKTA